MNLVACIAFGVVVTTAVAWGAALLAPMGPPKESETEWPFGQLVGPQAPGAAPEVRATYRAWSDGFGVRYQTELLEEVGDGSCFPAYRAFQVSCDAGWPCRAFVANNDCRGWKPGPRFAGFNQTLLSRTWLQSREVPIAIRWRGFAINVVLFGLAPWMGFHGFVATRRRSRMSRGCCGRCGYDVSSLTKCPECGVDRAAAV